MADPKQAPKKILTRCGERVVYARLSNHESSFLFGGGTLREVGQTTDGKDVMAMSLHPWGLAVVPKTPPAWAGKRIVVPTVHIAAVVIADDEV